MNNEILLTVINVKQYYPITGGILSTTTGFVKAVDGVDLLIKRGDTLGLVGESGCGKTTLGKLILRLEEPTDGEIFFEGENLLQCNKKQMRKLRRNMQMIFQDPYSSLDFRKTIGFTIGEPFLIHHPEYDAQQRKDRVLKLMEEVGLRSEYYDRYPHEFSGGQRQRIVIARAMALNPKLIICDEPVSALDVSIQSQIINLLQDLQEKYTLTYLFISHNLAVVKQISDKVAVMYLGRIVEISSNEIIFDDPAHPYTQALISASPVPNPKLKRERIILEGDVPSPIDSPPGCHFYPRCPRGFERCYREKPILQEINTGHLVRCHLFH